MRTSLSERLLDLVVSVFLWGFRILIVAAILIGTIASIRAGKYSSDQWIGFVVLGISQGSIYALIALGYTMVYGILRMINFAHGEIFMSGAFSAYFLAAWLNNIGFIDRNPVLGLLISYIICDDHVSLNRHAGGADCLPSTSRGAKAGAFDQCHRRLLLSAIYIPRFFWTGRICLSTH